MKRPLFILFFIIFSLLTASSASAEQINNFDVSININKDGTIDVSERIDYDFGSLQRHGIFRDIPYTKTNAEGKKFVLDFNRFSVADENGKSYKFEKSTSGDYIKLKIGDAGKTITGIHTYIIKYRVSGALTYFSDHDEIYWNVTGNKWPVFIVKSSAQVILPQNVGLDQIKLVCYTGSYQSKETECTSRTDGKNSYFISNINLESYQGMTIAVSFPKNITAVLEPQEYVSFFDTFLGKIVLLLLAIVAILWYLVYPIWLIVKWYRFGRDPKVVGPVSAWFDPPKNRDGRLLSPAETGALVDERVDMRDVAATIVDLARRGYFVIEERKKKDFYLIQRKDYLVDSNLENFERRLLQGLFSTSNEVHLKDKKLYSTVQGVEKMVYENMVLDGFFPENPKKVRSFYQKITAMAMFTFNFFLVISASIFGRFMSRKTLFGAQQAMVGRGLKNFLTSQSEQLAFQAKNQMMFEKLLPYAVAFGVEKIWAERFKDINLQNPEWFQSYDQRGFNSVYFTNSLNSSLSKFTSAATPISSSSGFSSGFGGGGSSGGGGGGGGGSW